MTYLVRWDGQTIDAYRDPVSGEAGPVPLGAVLREFRGVAGVSILRTDGTVVAEQVGSTYGFRHVPTGRMIYRRAARHVRHANGLL